MPDKAEVESLGALLAARLERMVRALEILQEVARFGLAIAAGTTPDAVLREGWSLRRTKGQLPRIEVKIVDLSIYCAVNGLLGLLEFRVVDKGRHLLIFL